MMMMMVSATFKPKLVGGRSPFSFFFLLLISISFCFFPISPPLPSGPLSAFEAWSGVSPSGFKKKLYTLLQASFSAF